jgi:hypothetical protein
MNLAGVELALEMVSRLELMQQVMAAHMETNAQDAMQHLMTSVLELLHYTDDGQRSAQSPEEA